MGITIEELAKEKGIDLNMYPIGKEDGKWAAEAVDTKKYVPVLINFSIYASNKKLLESQVRAFLEAI